MFLYKYLPFLFCVCVCVCVCERERERERSAVGSVAGWLGKLLLIRTGKRF